MRKILLLLAMTLTGCTSTSQLFYWGQYEDIIYTSYANPGELTASRQIELLSNEIALAQQNNIKPAPGLYAQLGTAAVENNQKQMAKDAFEHEAKLYPESKAFMDYLIRQLEESKK